MRKEIKWVEKMGHVTRCPKCGREFISKIYFGSSDYLGIVAMVMHSKRLVTDIIGKQHWVYCDRCFLTQEEWNKIEEN